MAMATRSAEAKSRAESSIANEGACGLSSDGDGRGKGRGKGRATLKDGQPQISQDTANGRRSTRSSCSIIQGTADNKVPQGPTPDSSTMTTRMTRRSSLRSSS